MKKLSLKKQSLRVLNAAELDNAGGGTGTSVIVIKKTVICPAGPPISILTKPSMVDGCPSALVCPTVDISTSVINPVSLKGNG
jgi:hypothetical protein